MDKIMESQCDRHEGCGTPSKALDTAKRNHLYSAMLKNRHDADAIIFARNFIFFALNKEDDLRKNAKYREIFREIWGFSLYSRYADDLIKMKEFKGN